MPGFAVGGAVIVAVVPFAAQPKRLVAARVADQPLGTPLKLRRTRSKNDELRCTLMGSATLPPVEGIRAAPALRLNVPRVAMRLTSSNGSWYGSGSVDVAQPKLPR